MGGEVSHDETDSMLHTWYYACAVDCRYPAPSAGSLQSVD